MPVIGGEGVNALLIRAHRIDTTTPAHRRSPHRSVSLHGWKTRYEAPIMRAWNRPPAQCSEETALSDNMPQSPTITIYTSAICPYCISAKNFLKSKGLEWTEIRIDMDPAERERMMARAKRTSVPQIFVGDVHVGGFDDMMALHRAGKFEPLLSGEGA